MAQPMEQRTPPRLNYYQVLGVSLFASTAEIRQAYREKSKLYHPDTTRLPLSTAREKFEQLNQAYAVLNSPALRQQYDLAQAQPLETKLNPTQDSLKSTVWGLNIQVSERPLSAGEIFALFILGLAFVGCLVLAVVVGVSRGELVIQAWS